MAPIESPFSATQYLVGLILLTEGITGHSTTLTELRSLGGANRTRDPSYFAASILLPCQVFGELLGPAIRIWILAPPGPPFHLSEIPYRTFGI